MVEDTGSLRQQIGETLGTVRSVVDQLREIKSENREREERQSTEIRAIKHEQRQTDQIVAGRLELINRQISEVDTRIKSVTEDVADIQSDMGETKTAIEDIKEPFQRFRNYGLFIISLAIVVWTVAVPFLQVALESWFKIPKP